MSNVEEYRAAQMAWGAVVMAWENTDVSDKAVKAWLKQAEPAEARLNDAVRALIADGVRVGNGFQQGRFVKEGMSTPNAIAQDLLPRRVKNR